MRWDVGSKGEEGSSSTWQSWVGDKPAVQYTHTSHQQPKAHLTPPHSHCYCTLPSFKDWLHGHTFEAALKAQCGCTASAAGLRRLLHDQRQHTHGHPERPEAAARRAALEPGGAVTRRFLAPNSVVLQVGRGAVG